MVEITVTFKILGMTCTMCALTIEKQLSHLPGVRAVTSNFALGQATITYDPDKISAKQLAQTISEVGYAFDSQRAEFEIAGIVCVSCVSTIENALKDIRGVIDGSVNPVTAKAVVEYDPSVVTVDELIEAIKNAGYDALEIQPVGIEAARLDREQRSRHRELVSYPNQFLFCVAFGIPLLLGMLVPYISVIPSVFMNPVLQFLLTTFVMVVVGYGFYRRAVVSVLHRGARRSSD